MSETVLVTGAAGFIGFHLARRLAEAGHDVVGIDNISSYYGAQLKHDRLAQLSDLRGFRFLKLDLADRDAVAGLFARERFARVFNLAAQAGVRYSITNPHAYIDANLTGFINLLEGCRQVSCQHLVYASSSSVYGANTRLPFSTGDTVDHPISLYAATKKSNELMAHAYSHLYGLPATGLRFFTVYGPWSRPDMAMSLFAKAILAGEPIKFFNNGRILRDFTYVGDIVEAIARLAPRPPAGNPAWSGDDPDPASSRAPWRVFNIGSSSPVEMTTVLAVLEKALGREAIREALPSQPGDLPATYADVSDLERETGFAPSTTLEAGIGAFAAWYRDYHKV